jgi:two-component system, chemotaxis family, chemotaxis protein CheY
MMSQKIDAKRANPLADLRLAVFDPERGVVSAVAAAAPLCGIKQVWHLTDTERALTRLDRNPPDVMLVAWRPPSEDGLKVCRAIRTPATSPCPFLPLVMICQHVTRDHVRSARDAGVDEFLAMPFTTKALRDRLIAIVLRRRGFVDVPGFFGPDRRRGAMAEFLGANRRSGGSNLIDPRTGMIYIDA